jgi:hypothetical protein
MHILQEKKKPHGVKYSPREKALFKGLPKDGKHTTTQKLVKAVYKNSPPFHARTAVLVILRRLINKIEFNKEPFRIARTDGYGSKPIEVWLEEGGKQ